MVTKKEMAKKETKKVSMKAECNDRLCPVHGDRKLKMRGRTFEGVVVKKLAGRVTIVFERMLRLAKYERYEKRRTKVHARLPDCMKDEVDVGNLIQIAETRPISKMIHCVVWKSKISKVIGNRKQVMCGGVKG